MLQYLHAHNIILSGLAGFKVYCPWWYMNQFRLSSYTLELECTADKSYHESNMNNPFMHACYRTLTCEMQDPVTFFDHQLDILPSVEVLANISCTVYQVCHPSDSRSSLSLLG